MSSEPRALVFPDASPQPTKIASDATLRASLEPKGFKEPQPLVFSAATPSVKVSLTAEPKALFKQDDHPLLSTVVEHCKAKTPKQTAVSLDTLQRMARELLPVTVEVVENYGQRNLMRGQQNTLAATQLSLDYSKHNIAQALEAALKAASANPGLLGRWKSMMHGGVQGHVARLQIVRQQQVQFLSQIRDLRPLLLADAQRLALRNLTLSAVLEVTKPTPASSIAVALEKRLRLLTAAVTQANLALSQLKLQEDTVTLQMAECDRLLSVTLSAQQLAQAVNRI